MRDQLKVQELMDIHLDQRDKELCQCQGHFTLSSQCVLRVPG